MVDTFANIDGMVDADADDILLLVHVDPLDDIYDVLHTAKRGRHGHFSLALSGHLDGRLLGMLRPM